MRRTIATLFLLMYSLANFGLSMRLDLCGDSVYGIGFYSTERVKAECCLLMAPDEDCCDSEQVFLQDSSDKAQPFETQTTPVVQCLILSAAFQDLFFRVQRIEGLCYAEAHAPPLPAIPLHLINSCFLI